MRSVSLIAALALIGLLPRASFCAQKSPTQSFGTEVVIDGAKNPERFPEWYVWECFFESFQPLSSVATQQNPPFLRSSLGVTESEFALILKELKIFQESKELLRKELQETRARLSAQKRSEDAIRDATQELNIQYRHRILDARGRVYEGLSAASLETLKKWIAQVVRGTSVHLSGRAATYFHLPW